MKLLTTAILLAATLVLFSNSNAQSSLELLQSNVQDVSIKDEPYEQNIESVDNHCILTVTVNNMEEQEEIVYLFNGADINPYKVSFDTKRRSVVINAETMGSKDLIHKSENGEIDGYDDELEFFATDIENARSVVEHFKEFVTGCQEELEEVDFVLGSAPSVNQAIGYLQDHVSGLKINDKQFNQEFIVDPSFSALSEITIVDETESETTQYRFNVADINPTTIDFFTKKEFVFLEGETKGERDLIEVYENGEKDNYDKNFSFYASDIEEARKLKTVLRYFSESAENISNTELDAVDDFNTVGQLNTHLTTKIVDVIIEDDNYEQSFVFVQDRPYLVTFTREYVNDGDVDEYSFNLSDIDENSIHFDTRRNEINIELETTGGKEVIEHWQNGELDSYEDELSIRSTDIESARVIVKTLKKAVEIAKEQYETDFVRNTPNPTLSQVQDYISTSMQEVVIGEDAYRQTAEFDTDNNCLLTYEIHDVSDGEILQYKFNMKDINVYKVTFETKREEVFVRLETEGGNDLIEVLEDGETDDFEDELNIRAAGIEDARTIVAAFETLITICEEE